LQLTATGVLGLLGVLAARPVEVVIRHELICVTIQPLRMAEQLVLAAHPNHKLATHKHAQSQVKAYFIVLYKFLLVQWC
jgi:hypothetical protein